VVGACGRCIRGHFEWERNGIFQISPTSAAPFFDVEVERNASAELDALAWDAARHCAAPSWGWGAVYRSEAHLKGTGDVKYRPRDVPAVPGIDAALRARFGPGRARESFEIPGELAAGLWYAPYPELRF